MASESLLNISKSSLHDRQQFVALDDESRLYTVNCGVPLGTLPIFNLHQWLDQLHTCKTSIVSI